MSTVLEQRTDVGAVAPDVYRAIAAIDQYVAGTELEFTLLELVRLRASQLNGCAYCVDMHTKDARAKGETEQRLYGLSVWRETPHYTGRERAALAWTEAVTMVHEGHVPDAVHEEARAEFDESELIALTGAVIAINAWNRLAVAVLMVPGTYEP